MKEKIVELLREIAKDTMTGSFGDATKKLGEDYINKKVQDKAVEKALEGETSEMVRELMGEFAAALQEEAQKPQTGYRNRELREIFEQKYREFHGGEAEDGDGKEALWQRFLICGKECLEHMAADSSFAERVLLKNSQVLREEVEKGNQTVEQIQKKMEEQSQKLDRERRGRLMPQVELDGAREILVESYCPELLAFGNNIILDQTEKRAFCADDLEGTVYIVTLPIKNLGDTEIRHIDCTSLRISLSGEDEYGEEGVISNLHVVEHYQKAGCDINIRPSGTQEIHLVVTWDEELEEDCMEEYLYETHNLGMLYLEMCLTVFGEEEKAEEEFLVYLKNLAEIVPVGKEGFPGRYKLRG